MAAVADPQGAVVLLWQPAPFAGAEVVNGPGLWSWNDLQTPDTAAAAPFYEELFGWATTEIPGTDGLDRTIAHEGRGIGGIMRAPAGVEHPYWTVYIGVADLDATLERIGTAGGQTIVEPMSVPAGRFAVTTTRRTRCSAWSRATRSTTERGAARSGSLHPAYGRM